MFSTTRSLLESTINLAVLDTVIKTRRVFEMPSVTADDVTDLQNLYRIMQVFNIIRHEKLAVIDPRLILLQKLLTTPMMILYSMIL